MSRLNHQVTCRSIEEYIDTLMFLENNFNGYPIQWESYFDGNVFTIKVGRRYEF